MSGKQIYPRLFELKFCPLVLYTTVSLVRLLRKVIVSSVRFHQAKRVNSITSRERAKNTSRKAAETQSRRIFSSNSRAPPDMPNIRVLSRLRRFDRALMDIPMSTAHSVGQKPRRISMHRFVSLSFGA